jgi:hypothetical protein
MNDNDSITRENARPTHTSGPWRVDPEGDHVGITISKKEYHALRERVAIAEGRRAVTR